MDLNGDGKMEIVVKSRRVEGFSTDVYEFRGSKVELVMSGGGEV
jgi:hypothetical protein